MMSALTPQAGQGPGWYPYLNGVRFFDGQEWTDQIAYAPANKGVSVWTIALGVAIGILLVQLLAGILFLLWLVLSIAT